MTVTSFVTVIIVGGRVDEQSSMVIVTTIGVAGGELTADKLGFGDGDDWPATPVAAAARPMSAVSNFIASVLVWDSGFTKCWLE